jgi:hypothetical protein
MEKRVAGLRHTGTDVEYRKYAGVGHGFGLGIGTSAEGWIADAIRFWAKQINASGLVEISKEDGHAGVQEYRG